MVIQVRMPAVANAFYPGDKEQLKQMINRLLSTAQNFKPIPKAIIAPHAGYIYSGPIAASAYASLREVAHQIKRIILLGPAHRVAFRGIAVSSADNFRTPLGDVSLDRNAINEILKFEQVKIHDEAHLQEHSLEVHIPFLQEIFLDFTLVPLVVGQCSPEKVSEVLQSLWGGDETFIIVSSDLSHYHSYQTAQELDKATSQLIESLQYEKIDDQGACGRMPIKGLLHLGQQIGLRCRLLDLRNSGDTQGGKERVVGYGAYHLLENYHYADKFSQQLLSIAKKSIEFYFKHHRYPGVDLRKVAEELQVKCATFVTLTLHGQLRGCIGSLETYQPLVIDLAHNACKAAFSDPRFPALTKEEFSKTDLSISILSATRQLSISSEEDLLHKLRPNIDGLILACDGAHGTFLPSVWKNIPQPKQFVSQLKRKMGLAEDFWSNNMQALVYETEIIQTDKH